MRTSTTKPLEQFIACDGTKWTAEVYYPMGTKHHTYWMITLWSKKHLNGVHNYRHIRVPESQARRINPHTA